jgi:ATPase family associated with various cellular activities (AAA)
MTDHPPSATSVAMGRSTNSDTSAAGDALQPELADVLRLGRRLVRRAVAAARAEDHPVRNLLHRHLGSGAGSMPIVSGSWLQYDLVNLQAGLDAWLARPGRRHELAGLTGFQHRMFGLGDLLEAGGDESDFGLGNVATVAMPAGSGGAIRTCVRCGIYLVTEGGARFAILLRAPDHHDPMEEVTLEVAADDARRAEQVVAEIRQLAVEHNVFRGQVISFGGQMFGHGRGVLLSFVERPGISRDDVVLPPDLLDGIERQVLTVQRHASRLRASGQHLKRGVLLYGAPGTGKTHTVSYLMGQMPQATIVLLSGAALQFISEACSVARLLQPSVIVVEDVDLIAEHRMPMGPLQAMARPHPLLFQLLNEMDGVGGDVDVTFLLTTNRADMLEEALAQRPGRVDHAAELPLPDAEARGRLIRLYRGNLDLDPAGLPTVIERTDGVTASFIKELLRKAALFAAEDGAGPDGAGRDGPLRVTDAHMSAALDQLLDTRNQLTRVLLGGQPTPGEPAGPP